MATLELHDVLLIITLALVVILIIFNFEMYRNILFIQENVQPEPDPPYVLRSFIAEKLQDQQIAA